MSGLHHYKEKKMLTASASLDINVDNLGDTKIIQMTFEHIYVFRSTLWTEIV